MSADLDLKLTNLAAETWRNAVQFYDPGPGGRLLTGYSPVLAVWDTNMFAGFNATGTFPAFTGAFPRLRSGSQPRLRSRSQPLLRASGAPSAPTGATGAFKTVSRQFRAFTESFLAAGQEPAEPAVTLKRVFRLPGRLPGVRLPAEADLTALARSAPTMARLDALARWLGQDGRLVSRTGYLTGDDAADAARQLGTGPVPLSLLWDYALTSDWFTLSDSARRGRARAVAGETAWRWAHGDDRGALYVWAAVFAAVAARTLDVLADADPWAARRLNFQGQGPALAIALFLARRKGMTSGDVEDLVRDGSIGHRPTSRLRRAWNAWVRQHGDPAQRLLGELADLGAVTLPQSPDAAVELTPLARWALREQFALDRINVPLLPPASARVSAANLVTLFDAVSEAEFEAAFARWTSDRDPGRAAQELLLLAGSSDPQGRLTAVRIARRIGIPAYPAWQDALKRPELRGHALIALSTMAGSGPESGPPLVPELDPGDMAGLAADLLATGLSDIPDPDEFAAQFAETVPAQAQQRVFALMAQSSHPDVARLLGVLSDYHPDHRVAADARQAARAIAKNRRSEARRRVPARAASA